jgi:hypothetical protein
MISEGYFVDWNGDTRRVERPGGGMSCRVVPRLLNGVEYLSVDVIDAGGFVAHEATYFKTLDDVQAAGVTVNLTE